MTPKMRLEFWAAVKGLESQNSNPNANGRLDSMAIEAAERKIESLIAAIEADAVAAHNCFNNDEVAEVITTRERTIAALTERVRELEGQIDLWFPDRDSATCARKE